MTLFPLDAVRNASIDRALEPAIEDVREDVLSFAWPEELGGTEAVVAAYDFARPRLNVLAGLLPANTSVLDISTGLGFLAVLLDRLGYRVVATEVDPAEAAFAVAHGIEVRPYCIGTSPPPFPPETFDAVILGEVIEHLKAAPIGVLSEVGAFLRPGGRFLLTTPNIARLAHLEALAAGENFLEPFPADLPPHVDATDHIDHVREYSVREVVEAAEAAGLRVDSVLMTGWGEAGYDLLPNPYSNEICVLSAVR